MLSRRKFLRGISMTGAAVQVGLPPLAAMFNMNGTAYAAETGEGRRHRQAVPRVVERQRHSRALLDSARDGRKLRADGVPLAARPRARLRARAQRRRQRGGPPQRPGQRSLQRAVRADDRHRLHGPWRRRPVDRSDSCREDRHEDALPLAADRRGAGIARRERPPQHDVGGLSSARCRRSTFRTTCSIACSA